MPVQKCSWEPRQNAACGDEFGMKLAEKWFGLSEDAIATNCGRYVRGRFAGKVRGYVVWVKCRVGGWSYKLQGVLRPGMIFARFADSFDAMNRAMNETIDEFMIGAQRVDTCYGNNPADNRAKKSQQEKYFPLYLNCKQAIDASNEITGAIVAHVPMSEWPRVAYDQIAHVFATYQHAAKVAGIAV